MCAAVLTLTLSACGDDTESDASVESVIGPAATGAPFDPDAPLGQEQVEQVLLRVGDLENGFDLRPPAENREGTEFGCLGQIDDLQEFDKPPATYAESVYVGRRGLPRDQGQVVFSGAGSYDSVAAAESSYAELRASLDGCDRVKVKTQGYRYDLLVAASDRSTPPADEQFDVVAKGTFRYKKQGPWSYVTLYAVARVGNEVLTTAIQATAQGSDLDQTAEDMLKISVDRLEALA